MAHHGDPEAAPLFRPGCCHTQRIYGGSVEHTDFMQDWPQWQYAGEIPMGPLIAVWVLGLFIGPVVAPLLVICVVLSQIAKASATGFDYFLMLVVLYLLAVMICVAVNCWFVLQLETQDPGAAAGDAEGDDLGATYNGTTSAATPPLDKWGPIAVYIVVYCWLAWVLARYFRSLSTDRYQSYPEKLQRLRGVPFYPKLIARRVLHGRTDVIPPNDVPGLIQKLSLYRDIFAVDKETDRQSNLMRSFTSDPLTGSEVFSCWSEGGSSDGTPVYELGAADVVRSGWAVPLVLGALLAGVEVFIMRYVFGGKDLDTYPPSPSARPVDFHIFCSATAFWWFACALVWTIILALFMLFHRQLRSLIHFSHMTSVFVPQPYSRFIIDLRSARNLLLWHEARTHLVDQVMQPTSFLRAVFDPTCFMMAWAGSGAIITLVSYYLVAVTDEMDQLTGVMLCKLLQAALFFQGVTYFTRNIQRVLKNHEGMISHWQLAVLRDLNELESEGYGVPTPTAREVTDAEALCHKLLGSVFDPAAYAKANTEAARLAWRAVVIHQRLLSRKRRLTPDDLDALQKAMVLLEHYYFRNTPGGCAWEACGDNVVNTGPCYVVPPCGSVSTTTTRDPSAVVSLTAVNPLERHQHRRAELYRRIWLIESILTHVQHRYIRPTVLGMHLSGLLDVGIAALLAFNAVVLIKASVSEDYYETNTTVFV